MPTNDQQETIQQYQLILTSPQREDFSLFHRVDESIYPAAIVKQKSTEDLNLPYLHTAFVVLKDAIPLGRCCLYFNPFLKFNDQNAACIGNFECIHDESISSILFDASFAATRDHEIPYVIGPMNGSTWDSYRLPVVSDFPVFFMEPFYPNWYHQLWHSAGFGKIGHYSSNLDQSEETLDLRSTANANRLFKEGIILRQLDLDNYEQELDLIYDFCMVAFNNNFLFTPITKEYFKDKYRMFLPFINPKYVLIAENKNKSIVGLIFCVFDLKYYDQKCLIIKTIARKPQKEYRGMGRFLLGTLKKVAHKNGIHKFIHAFIHEENLSNNLSNQYSSICIREYYLYGKNLI